jgi:hypothetical protein
MPINIAKHDGYRRIAERGNPRTQNGSPPSILLLLPPR